MVIVATLWVAPAMAQDPDGGWATGKTYSSGKTVGASTASRRLPVAGRTVEVRLEQDEWRGWYGRALGEDWLEATLTDTFARAGFTPVWDVPDIRGESDDREYLSGNRWVKRSTLPHEGTIEVAELVATVTASLNYGEDGGRVRLGNHDLDLEREVARTRLAVVIRHRESGKAVATIAVTGVANANRRVAASLFNSFFRSRGVDVDYAREDPEELQARAMERALENLRKALSTLGARGRRTSPPR